MYCIIEKHLVDDSVNHHCACPFKYLNWCPSLANAYNFRLLLIWPRLLLCLFPALIFGSVRLLHT